MALSEEQKKEIREEVEAVKKKEERAKNRPNDRGVVVPPNQAVPYDKDNIHRSKAEFITHKKELKEKRLKIAEFAAGLEKPKAEKPPEVKVDAPKAKAKPRGRPKKIE